MHGGEAPVGPQGEGDGRQLFTICAGGDQTVCRALGSQAGLGVHAGGSPWGQVTCPGLLAFAKPVRLMNSSEKRLSRHKSRSVRGFQREPALLEHGSIHGPWAREPRLETSMKR